MQNLKSCIVFISLLATSNLAIAAKRIEIKLWPKGAPGEKAEIGAEKVLPPRGTKKVIRLANVTEPMRRGHSARTAAGRSGLRLVPFGRPHVQATKLYATRRKPNVRGAAGAQRLLRRTIDRKTPASWRVTAPGTLPIT